MSTLTTPPHPLPTLPQKKGGEIAAIKVTIEEAKTRPMCCLNVPDNSRLETRLLDRDATRWTLPGDTLRYFAILGDTDMRDNTGISCFVATLSCEAS